VVVPPRVRHRLCAPAFCQGVSPPWCAIGVLETVAKIEPRQRGAPPRRDPPRDGDVIEPLALDDEAFEARKAAAKRQAVAFVEGLPSPLVNHAPLRVEDAQSDRVG
jgi:hypothetical protein